MNVILFVGLDVHNDSIAISIAPSDSTEVRRWGVSGGTHEHVQRALVGRGKALPNPILEPRVKKERRIGPRQVDNFAWE